MLTLDPNLHHLGIEVLFLFTKVGIVTFLEGWNHYCWCRKCWIAKQILLLIEILISLFDQTQLFCTLPSHPILIQVIPVLQQHHDANLCWLPAYHSRNTPEDLIILNQPVQLHDTRSIHMKIGKGLVICHLRTIMKHPFPIAVPLSIWTMTEVSLWLQHSQLCWYTIINFIFNYPHCQSKNGHKPLQPDLLLQIRILFQGCPFGKLRHFRADSFECNIDTFLWF